MQDKQIELVQPKFPGALFPGVERLVVAVVADPDFGLDEDLFARNPAVAQRLPDLAFVEVGGRGVDVTVSGLEGRADGSLGLLWWGLEDPSPTLGIVTPLFNSSVVTTNSPSFLFWLDLRTQRLQPKLIAG